MNKRAKIWHWVGSSYSDGSPGTSQGWDTYVTRDPNGAIGIRTIDDEINEEWFKNSKEALENLYDWAADIAEAAEKTLTILDQEDIDDIEKIKKNIMAHEDILLVVADGLTESWFVEGIEPMISVIRELVEEKYLDEELSEEPPEALKTIGITVEQLKQYFFVVYFQGVSIYGDEPIDYYSGTTHMSIILGLKKNQLNEFRSHIQFLYDFLGGEKKLREIECQWKERLKAQRLHESKIQEQRIGNELRIQMRIQNELLEKLLLEIVEHIKTNSKQDFRKFGEGVLVTLEGQILLLQGNQYPQNIDLSKDLEVLGLDVINVFDVLTSRKLREKRDKTIDSIPLRGIAIACNNKDVWRLGGTFELTTGDDNTDKKLLEILKKYRELMKYSIL